jgi:hypothetical protein
VSLKDWVINQFLKQNTMLKNILKLNGVQRLSRNEQKEVIGGIRKPKDDICNCAVVNWGTRDKEFGMTFSTTYSDGAIPVGLVYVNPRPACCG